MTKKPVYEISRVDIVPELDGWLQSPCWQTAKWVDRFLAMDTWQPGKPVAAALLWDDNYLYAGIKISEPQMGMMHTGNLPIRADDIIEIYLDINGAGQEHFVLSINALGEIVADKWLIDNPGWGTRHPFTLNNVKSVSKLTGSGWQIELAVPFNALNITAPKPNETWNINICRIDHSAYQWSFWAPADPVEHSYEILPAVQFSDKTNKTAADIENHQEWPQQPRFTMRGFMYDTSRGSIIYTPEYWIQRFPWLKEQGFNTFLLYFENHLNYEKHHAFAPKGSWTMDDLTRVQVAGQEYGIDVIPAQTSIGHCTGILTHPEYAEMAEEGSDSYQFCTSHPKSLQVLTEMFDELASKSQSPYISINADESAYLGLCPRCQSAFPGWSKGKIFQHHIMPIYDVIKSHGKRMMMWDDMLWQYPEAVEGLPRDIILLDWHYSQHRRYPSIDHWRSLGFDVVVCPGMYAVENAFWIADHGAESGAMGIINTLWEDHSLPIGSRWQHFMATSWAAHAPVPSDINKWYAQAGESLFGPGGEHIGHSLAAQDNLKRNGHPISTPMIEWKAISQTINEARQLLNTSNLSGINKELLEEFIYSRRLIALQTKAETNSKLDEKNRLEIDTEMAILLNEGLSRWDKQCCVPSQKPAFLERYTAIENELVKKHE
jgi:hypothetical protein